MLSCVFYLFYFGFIPCRFLCIFMHVFLYNLWAVFVIGLSLEIHKELLDQCNSQDNLPDQDTLSNLNDNLLDQDILSNWTKTTCLHVRVQKSIERATHEMICKTYCLTRVTKAKRHRSCGWAWVRWGEGLQSMESYITWVCKRENLVYGLNIHLCAWKKNKAMRGIGPNIDNIVDMRIGALQLVSKGPET